MTILTLDWSLTDINGSISVANVEACVDVTVAAPDSSDRCWHLGHIAGQHALVRSGGEGRADLSMCFDKPVANVHFTLMGIDAAALARRVKLFAYNAIGDAVPFTCTDLAPDHFGGESLMHGGAALFGVAVLATGPIVSLRLHSDQGPGANPIGLSDITFSVFASAANVACDASKIESARFADVVSAVDVSRDNAAGQTERGDIDVLDLTGDGVAEIAYDDVEPEAGIVTFSDGSKMTFSQIENVIPCFTPGTKIATPKGEVPAEQLKAGDRVLTRGKGIQYITWAGRKVLNLDDLKVTPNLLPVMIRKGALGNDLPERDMMVSPNHRVLLVSEKAKLYFGESEVLISAKHMAKMEGIEVMKAPQATYIHFMCQQHEVVLSNGAWTESFQPSDYSLKGVDADLRDELFLLFPELATKEGLRSYRAARRTVKKKESRLFFWR